MTTKTFFTGAIITRRNPVISPQLARTLSGLYLVKPIDMDKSFQPSPQLASYMDKIRKFEKDMLEKRKQAISKTFL